MTVEKFAIKSVGVSEFGHNISPFCFKSTPPDVEKIILFWLGVTLPIQEIANPFELVFQGIPFLKNVSLSIS